MSCNGFAAAANRRKYADKTAAGTKSYNIANKALMEIVR
jgi:hypothetical protein